MNTLYYGDNLPLMRQMAKDSVDLIYLDPPFNSQRTYNLLYANMTGRPVPEQVEAFFDTWELDAEKDQRARDMPKLMLEYGIDNYYARFWDLWIEALRNTQPHLLAYLIYMVERLLHMRVLLRPTGSIYLHCDATVSHYIKIMMDAIFGHENFRDAIIWKRRYGSFSTVHTSKKFGVSTDTILFYTKGNKSTFHPQYTFNDPEYKQYVERTFKHINENGRKYRIADLSNPGYRPNLIYEYKGYKPPANGWAISREKMEQWDNEGRLYFPKKKDGRIQRKRFLDELKGKPVQNLWDDIDMISSQSHERLGYQTQKPIALLKRIINASSNKDDVVFDPFCGCGTTIYASHEMERQWIGCDIAILPIHLIQHILEERYRLVEGTPFILDGIPVSVEQAEALFPHDPFQFQHWVVERIGGFPMQKKVADRGIDGRLYFETRQGLKEMVLSVKGGTIRPTDVRDLRGVLARESQAELAGFLSLHEPTRAMREEAATAGIYEYEGVRYPRLQLLTVRDILEEKHTFHTPTKIGVKGTTGQLSFGLR